MSERSSARLSAGLPSSEVKRARSMTNLISMQPRDTNLHPSPAPSASRKHAYASDGDALDNNDDEVDVDEDITDEKENDFDEEEEDSFITASSSRRSSGRTSRQSMDGNNSSRGNSGRIAKKSGSNLHEQYVVAPKNFYNTKDQSTSVGGRTLRNRESIKAPDRAIDQREAPSEFKGKRKVRKSQRQLRDEARSKKFEDKFAHLGKREHHGRAAKSAIKYHDSDSDDFDEEDSEGTYDDDDDDDAASSGEEDFSFMSMDSTRSNGRRNNNNSGNSKNNKAKSRQSERENRDDMKRREMRAELTKESTLRRNNFLLAKRHLFEPLLGERNYISKLDESFAANGIAEEGDELDVIESGSAKKETSPKAKATPTIVPYKDLEKQPEEVNAIMKSYQLKGLSFLVYLYNNGLSGILGDEMGLGKTLQTLSLFSYVSTNYPPQDHQPHRPFLVICPLSVLTSWVNEAKKFTPHLRAMRLHGPVRERGRLKYLCEHGLETGKDGSEHPVHPEDTKRGWDIVVTSYETFVAEKVWFRRAFMWRYCVLDEGHAIKNSESIVSKTLNSIGSEYRLILTGTPLQNDLLELWSLFHWLYPEVFQDNTADTWKVAFNLTKGRVDTDFLTSSRKLLEVFMLRRMKNSPSVNLGLPEKEEVVLFVPLSPMQRAWYKSILTKLDESTLSEIFSNSKDKESDEIRNDVMEQKRLEGVEAKVESADGVVSNEVEQQWKETEDIVKKSLQQAKNEPVWRKLMNLLMQLRKVCNHPYLMPHAMPDPYFIGQHIILASSKFILLEKLIKQLVLTEDRKVLIFSGFTKTLDICEDFLHLVGGDGEKFRYCRLDGQTSRGRRNLSIRLFNKPNSEYKVFLISTKAGGLGINLTSATEIVMLDASWNPQVDLQAEARSHRIGQTKKVTIYRIMTQGTVEEQMIGRIQKKLYLSAKITESMREVHAKGEDEAGETLAEEDDGPQMTTNQLMTLVRRGAQAIAAPEVDPKEMLNWDWETMLKECKDSKRSSDEQDDAIAKEEHKGEEDAKNKNAEQEWLNSVEKVETRIFEGKRLQKEAAKASKKLGDLSRSDRRQGKNRTVLIDGYEVLKETVGNADWEAVATFAGKDPRLRDPPKRKKGKVNHQEFCQVCLDGGDIILCTGCPRSYHAECLAPEMRVKTKGASFYCPQHECHDCEQKSADVGNLIYRCRWCERGYCEDCLDFDEIELVGDTMLEYELLDYPAVQQCYYIVCGACKELMATDKKFKAVCDNMIAEWETALEEKHKAEEAASLTDAATLNNTSGVLTPANNNNDSIMIIDDDNSNSNSNNSKATNGFAKLDKDQVASDINKNSKQKTLDTFFGGKGPKAANAVVVPIMSPGRSKKSANNTPAKKSSAANTPARNNKRKSTAVVDLVDENDSSTGGGNKKAKTSSRRKSMAGKK